MDIFAKRLTERAKQLGISNAEVARRAELDERRYAHYASGRREPDLATLVRIARALRTSPNWLLNVDEEGAPVDGRHALLSRLRDSARLLSDVELDIITRQTDALLK